MTPPTQAEAIRAAVHSRYGPPDCLEVRQVPRPEPGPGELVVRVRAAAVNPLDWYVTAGLPLIARASMGMRRPKQPLAGVDLAGVVQAVGSAVTQFQIGDEVFGVAPASWPTTRWPRRGIWPRSRTPSASARLPRSRWRRSPRSRHCGTTDTCRPARPS